MIKIIKDKTSLLLEYSSDDPTWVDEKLKKEGKVPFGKTFTFSKQHLVKDTREENGEDDTRTFFLGKVSKGFYKVDRNVLGLKFDLLLSEEMEISEKTFIANRNISIFGKVDNLLNEQIVIGGESKTAIPINEFNGLLRNFPTSHELTKYADARIARILKDYFGTMSDAEATLAKYFMRKRKLGAGKKPVEKDIKTFELKKFEFLKDQLENMLREADSYRERDWQRSVVGLLRLIFPKYIAILEQVRIKASSSDPNKAKYREIDLALVDANGTVDIVEIKRPSANGGDLLV